MQHVNDIASIVAEQLAATASSDVVAGSPVQVGTVTIVPISRISLGIGGGGGSGEGDIPEAKRKAGAPESGKGTGGGSGGGAKVRPVAVVVFSPAGLQVLTIPDRKGKIEKLLERLPDLVERFKGAAH